MNVLNTPMISIITVVKNDFAGFRVTANSLISQNDRDFEWIIVDSSTSDEISQLLLGDEFIGISTHYLRELPRGIYAAMNVGWKNSHGLFVWYLNAGDYFSSGLSIEIAKHNLDSVTNALAFPVLHVTYDGFVYAITIPEIQKVSLTETYAIMNHQGVLVRREVIEFLGGFDESLKYAADGKLLDQISKNFVIKICDQAVVAFVHGGASSSNHKKVWEEIKTYRVNTISPLQIYMRTFKTKLRAVVFQYSSKSPHGWLSRVFLRKRLKKIMGNSDQTRFYMDNINPSR
jgi:glycosyltransferase involved in cell wall biosynthesis